ncbi:trp operon repressor [Kistimonas asteriae]|uniref:trp operon repressor n=1 Tax=Kistimonas asteriae TaxID=517724 RepID=UPI001BA81F03
MFIDLIQSATNRGDLQRLFKLMLTREEHSAINGRVAIAKALIEGKESQREIATRLGVSIATVTRGSNNLKSMNDGERDFLMQAIQAVNNE